MGELNGARIAIKGVVQGVGFRPFVFTLARQLELTGWVRNTSAGVDIEVDGPAAAINAFVESLKNNAPPLARIDDLQVQSSPPQGFRDFEIVHSQPIEHAFQPISPDVCICPDCLKELLDPADRRYLYPFINCTNCGPRFTIIEDIPYDRPNTTMAGFPLCAQCASEYQDPLNRRFHAEPVACPLCGPQIWLELGAENPGSPHPRSQERTIETLAATQRLLRAGKIVAIKGLGGFHLACDAQNPQAVTELRRRKLRVDKPFAVMMPDLQTVQEHCQLSEEETRLLESRPRPIVISPRRVSSTIAEMVAPGQETIGVMLPYTPLHYLLFTVMPGDEAFAPAKALVMTSGNLSEEPIATANDEARRRLGSLADAFLMHDRPIRTRCDDSVVRSFDVGLPSTRMEKQNNTPVSIFFFRRSRGYAPDAIRLPWATPEILATGAELKNTFCLTRQEYAFVSHHIGDLENYETLNAFEDGIQHYQQMFRIDPQIIAYDLHPNYLATRYALQRAEHGGLATCGVQHHHAHIAACMTDNHLAEERRVIGVSFDGTGFGEDACIWGGEFMICSFADFVRPYHLQYTPLPGGDKAIREPWRMALSWLHTAGIPWSDHLLPVRYLLENETNASQRLETLQRQIQSGLNAPQTSSVGRLFDAIAALVGLRQVVNYEAQAAIELETIADPDERGGYEFLIEPDLPQNGRSSQPGVFNPAPVFEAVLEDLHQGLGPERISARFHNGLAQLVCQVCQQLREQSGIRDVALSGGVWQNMKLLHETVRSLHAAGFTVLVHRQVPANDGGISLGQAAVAASRSRQN